MADFNVGDVVKLKSGGPVMTVEEVYDYSVKCAWFNKSGKPEREEFAPEMLKEFKRGVGVGAVVVR